MNDTQTPRPVERSWLGRNWLWVVPVGCVIPVLCCGAGGGLFFGIFSAVFGMIKSSEPYQESLARVRASSEVQEALGTPLEPAFMVSGNFNSNGPSGNANLSYTVSGPRGSGTVYVAAQKTAGEWTFQTLVVQFREKGERIDLLAEE